MNNTLKNRVLSVLLALVMVLSMLPVSVFAEEGTTPPTSEPEQLVTEPTEPEVPTEPPTEEPTEAPTEALTEALTEAPTETPTEAPIAAYAANHDHNSNGTGGCCSVCEKPIVAVVNRRVYCVTLAEAFAACDEWSGSVSMKTDATLDESLTVADYRVEIYLNGHSIGGDGSITVNYAPAGDSGGLYITSGKGISKIDVPVTVGENGSLRVYENNGLTFGKELTVNGKAHLKCESASFGKITVGSDAALTTNGVLSVDELTIDEGAAVQLSGGTYKKINAPATAKAGDLLASGYVFASAEGIAIDPNTLLSGVADYPLNVILCPHTALAADGTCAFCGASVEAKIGDRFFGTFSEAVTYANENPGSTIVLQSDISLSDTTRPEDLPYIAADTTLNLNGKTLDMVTVGKVEYSEDDSEVKSVTPGNLKLTGNGRISEEIRLYGGAVTVTDGTISGLYVDAYAPCTATITGGEILTLSTMDETGDAAVNVTVSGGAVYQVLSHAGTIIFNNNEEYTDITVWSIYSGKVIINGGTFNFTLPVCAGSLILNGGTFSGIKINIFASTLKLADLLGEGRAFYGEDDSVINAAGLTELTNVTVKEHTHHSFTADRKCTECGAPCKHPSVSLETGKCAACGAQFAAALQVGDSISYHASFEAAIDAAPRNMSEAVTITLLIDTPAYNIWGTRNITLDMNGKHLLGDTVTVNDHCKLTLTGSFDEFSLPLIVEGDENGTGELDRTGILVVAPTGGKGVVKDVNAKDASRVTVLGGTIESLSIQATDTEKLSYIDLAGGTYKNISFLNINGNITLTDLLAPGCAFRCDEDFSKYKAGALIDYGFQLYAKSKIQNLSVVSCTHPSVDEGQGCCVYCGKRYAAKITTADGTESYLEALTAEDVNGAAGGTVKLLQDVTGIIKVNASCTIELNGRTMEWLSANYADEITVRGSGCVTNLFIGSENSETPHNTTLVLEKDSSGSAPTIGKLAVYNTENTQLTCGTFTNGIERCDAAPNTPTRVVDLLAEGYALTDTAGKVVNGYTKAILSTVTVTKHTHEFTKNAEGLDECACGVTCAHESIGEDGKCSYCHYQMYVAFATTAGGEMRLGDNDGYFSSLEDAWKMARQYTRAELKLLCDVTLDGGDDCLSATSLSNFILDLNGKMLEAEARGCIIQVDDGASLTIKNGSIYNNLRQEAAEGQLSYGGANAIEVAGGSVVLENLELAGGEGESDEKYIKPCPVKIRDGGSLTASGCTIYGTLLVWPSDSTKTTTLQLTSTTMTGGLDYIFAGDKKDAAVIQSCFAEGNLLLTDEGKYIDLANDAYWTILNNGTVSYAQFTYPDSAMVVPHEHSYANGACVSCGLPCDHSGDDHSQKASYFKQAVCSVCGASYGDLVQDMRTPDITAEGDLPVMDFADAKNVTYDRYINGSITIRFTLSDDSYTQEGFDPAKDSVKLYYWLTEKAVDVEGDWTFKEAFDDGKFSLVTDDQITFTPPENSDGETRIIYLFAEDTRGNRRYVTTNGFTIDLTKPEISLVSPVAETLEEGETYNFCKKQVTLQIAEAHLDTLEATEGATVTKQADGSYQLTKNPGLMRQTITVTATDKAGNRTQVTITLHDSHEFNAEGVCTRCGANAVAKVSSTNGTAAPYFIATVEELCLDLRGSVFADVTVTLLENINLPKDLIISGKGIIFDLNGKGITGSDSLWGAIRVESASDVTILSSAGTGSIYTGVYQTYEDSSLTMGEGIGRVLHLYAKQGHLSVYSGEYNILTTYAETKEKEAVDLYGGKFGSLELNGTEKHCSDLLAKGYRFDKYTYDEAAKVSSFPEVVSVILCDHSNGIAETDLTCHDCGLQLLATVEDGETTLCYDNLEEAIRYAETHENSVIKLWRDLTLNAEEMSFLWDGDNLCLNSGTYTLDFNGVVLTLEESLYILSGCNLTLADSLGDGAVYSLNREINVRPGGHLTVLSGDFTDLAYLTACGEGNLLLMGGSFQQINCNPYDRVSCSPLDCLGDGYALAFSDGTYVSERNVNSSDIPGYGTIYWVNDVSVVPAPMSVTTQPKSVISLYETSPAAYRPNVEVTAACVLDGAEAGEVTATLVKNNGDVMATQTKPAAETVSFAFSTESITADDGGGYRIKLAYRGYELYSESFVINIANCNHTVSVGRWLGHGDKSTCPECHCDIAAAIQYKDSERDVTYVVCYVDAADAFAAAQTDAYTDCTLTLLRDCAESLTVTTGSFLLCTASGCKMQGDIKVEQGAKLGIIGYNGSTAYSAFTGAVTCAGELTVDYAVFTGEKFKCDKDSKVTIKNATIGGNISSAAGAAVTVERTTIRGNVTCAKGGKITAENTTIKGTVNCLGEGDFTHSTFEKNVGGKGGSTLELMNCELKADLSVSGTARLAGNRVIDVPSVSGEITVNNGGKLTVFGSDCTTMLVKAGGEAITYSDTEFTGTVTLESDSTLTINGGTFAKLAALSGSTLSVEHNENSPVTITEAEIGDVKGAANATFYAGVTFGHLSVNGQRPIDCLAEGLGYWDNAREEITDGRNQILSNVTVVTHEHDCVWKTTTHEKLCGCGYVAATDTAAPVFSDVENGGIYYGGIQFSVSDENEFTVTIDGSTVTNPLNTFLIEPDNQSHVITATDIAGNTATVTISVMKIYRVTLSSGTGYTITGEPFAKHGQDYTFTVELAEGYSKTDDFMVDVNGAPLRSDTDSYTYESVESELHITVFGVADITPPDAEITIGKNSFKDFLNKVTFGLFFKSTQTVTVTASDAGSGLKTVEYLLSETAFESTDAITGDWTALEPENGTASFSIEPQQKAFVYVRATDESGNVTVVNSEGVVVYTDAEMRSKSATYVMGSDADASFTINRNDNRITAVYNGTQKLTDNDDYTRYAYMGIKLNNRYLRTLAAGEYTIRVTLAPLGEDYVERDGNEAPAELTAKLIVAKKTPTIDHKLADGKTYDGNPIGAPTYNTDSTGVATFEYKPADADDTAYTTTAPKDVGRYIIRISLAESDAFQAASSLMNFEIFPKDVTISGAAAANKVYDATTAAEISNAGALVGVVGDDKVSIVPGKAAFDDKNVGTAKAVTFTGFAITGDDAANYELSAQPAAGTADITAKEVTITGAAVEATKAYDGTAEAKLAATGTLSEICDGDELTVTAGTAAYDDKNVGTGKTVTFSGFALTGKDAANYTLTAQPASVTADITVKEVTITGATVEASKVYDGTTAAKVTNAGAPSENFDGENLTVKAGTAAYDNKNVGTGKTVTFTGFALTGEAAGNYLLTAQPADVTADITAKEVTITGATVEASKVYDGTTAATITNAGAPSAICDGDELTVKVGTAAYADKNVGTGKTVSFSGFMLDGKDAANYKLTAQPADTTANITAKTLTIDGLKVHDKQYDGTTAATIDGTPTLVGVADGDTVQLLNGTPSFESEKIGKDIPIHFTAFALFGDADTIANYTLTQPTGITASIVEYLADGTEYRVNSNDWINTDFVVTANDGWLLSLTDTAEGAWTQTLSASDETADGSLTFYVRNAATGVISAAVTEHYKIDKTCPTGTVALNGRSAFQTILNKISFGLLFNSEVNVKLSADDDASGIKSILYYKSDRLLDDAAVRALTDWTDNSDFNIPAEDMAQFVVYVRIADNAGNVTYIGSDGATFDTTAPEVVGVEDRKTYYVTKRVAVDDENPDTVTLNEETVGTVFSLKGDMDATYVIHAVDKAGNETTVTVTMKPISSITDAIAAITVDDVKSSDAAAIAAVERQLLDIAETFDDEESTPDEWQQLVDGAANCKALAERIAVVAAEIDRITAAANGYDIATVTSDDKAAIEQLIADIDALLNGDNLTDAEREALEALRAALEALLDRIAAAKAAAEAPEIVAVKDITKDNVKPEDKEALEKAQEAIEDALRDYGDNYTEAERKALEEQKDKTQTLLDRIAEALKPTEDVCKPFTDIDQNAWYHEGVHYMIENGLMNGVGNGMFAPNGTVTRAMLVTILYRQAGSPSVAGKTNPFTDAQKGYYADAVTWAYAHKITNGTTETSFDPDVPATREQIATILYRREGEPEIKQDLSAFSDADQISDYAYAAMQWAVAERIILGDGNRLNARGDATRAEISTMLMRYLSK